ncbi:MAG: hypothetical protein EOP48_29700 [Sphingobacteriales bacterium]|nr:MAG: hypothetical protein EOP48_29700 [Sphingobacteriales bacterium]
MYKSRTQTRETVELTNQTQHALSNVKISISKINDVNIQIATATEEQTMVADEIHRNVVNISKVTEDTFVAVRMVKQHSQELLSTSEDLKIKVSHFKL